MKTKAKPQNPVEVLRRKVGAKDAARVKKATAASRLKADAEFRAAMHESLMKVYAATERRSCRLAIEALVAAVKARRDTLNFSLLTGIVNREQALNDCAENSRPTTLKKQEALLAKLAELRTQRRNLRGEATCAQLAGEAMDAFCREHFKCERNAPTLQYAVGDRTEEYADDGRPYWWLKNQAALITYLTAVAQGKPHATPAVLSVKFVALAHRLSEAKLEAAITAQKEGRLGFADYGAAGYCKDAPPD